jgi:hypothetical protein
MRPLAVTKCGQPPDLISTARCHSDHEPDRELEEGAMAGRRCDVEDVAAEI